MGFKKFNHHKDSINFYPLKMGKKNLGLESFFVTFAPSKFKTMDAVWYGIAAFFEFIFKIVKPIGMKVDILFFIIGLAGSAYWLWYTVFVKKGGRNYLSDTSK